MNWKIKFKQGKTATSQPTPEIWFGLGARLAGQTYKGWFPLSKKTFNSLKGCAADLPRKFFSLLSIRGTVDGVPLLDGTAEVAAQFDGLLSIDKQILQLDGISHIRLYLSATQTYTMVPSMGVLTEHVLSMVDTSLDQEKDDEDDPVLHVPSSSDPGLRPFQHVHDCDLIDAGDRKTGLVLYATVRTTEQSLI